jgi:hypothetical protein
MPFYGGHLLADFATHAPMAHFIAMLARNEAKIAFLLENAERNLAVKGFFLMDMEGARFAQRIANNDYYGRYIYTSHDTAPIFTNRYAYSQNPIGAPHHVLVLAWPAIQFSLVLSNSTKLKKRAAQFRLNNLEDAVRQNMSVLSPAIAASLQCGARACTCSVASITRMFATMRPCIHRPNSRCAPCSKLSYI